MSGPITASEATALESAEAPVVPTAEVETNAHRDWTERAARFGHVDSELPRYEIGPPPWRPH